MANDETQKRHRPGESEYPALPLQGENPSAQRSQHPARRLGPEEDLRNQRPTHPDAASIKQIGRQNLAPTVPNQPTGQPGNKGCPPFSWFRRG